MYIPELWIGMAAGVVIGAVGLIGLIHVAANWQRNKNRR